MQQILLNLLLDDWNDVFFHPKAIAVNVPRHNLNPLADVISALLSKHHDFFVKTMTEIISVDQFPVPNATQADKQLFLKKIVL